jgi:hypothetical protein
LAFTADSSTDILNKHLVSIHRQHSWLPRLLQESH